LTLWRSIFGCVVEEIGEHLSETHRIAVDDERFMVQHEADLVFPCLYRRLAHFEGLLDHGGEVEMLLPELDFCRS